MSFRFVEFEARAPSSLWCVREEWVDPLDRSGRAGHVVKGARHVPRTRWVAFRKRGMPRLELPLDAARTTGSAAAGPES